MIVDYNGSSSSITKLLLPLSVITLGNNPMTERSNENILQNVSEVRSSVEDSNDFYKSYTDISYYNQTSTEVEKIDIITNFVKKILSNSKDLDGDIVRMVNENFWDLI